MIQADKNKTIARMAVEAGLFKDINDISDDDVIHLMDLKRLMFNSDTLDIEDKAHRNCLRYKHGDEAPYCFNKHTLEIFLRKMSCF